MIFVFVIPKCRGGPRKEFGGRIHGKITIKHNQFRTEVEVKNFKYIVLTVTCIRIHVCTKCCVCALTEWRLADQTESNGLENSSGIPARADGGRAEMHNARHDMRASVLLTRYPLSTLFYVVRDSIATRYEIKQIVFVCCICTRALHYYSQNNVRGRSYRLKMGNCIYVNNRQVQGSYLKKCLVHGFDQNTRLFCWFLVLL